MANLDQTAGAGTPAVVTSQFLCHCHGGSRNEIDCTICQAEETASPAYEIRVRWDENRGDRIRLTDPDMTKEHALNLAVRRALGQDPFDGGRPHEVLLVTEDGPIARLVDGHKADLPSLTPGHPGGCSCGECRTRWQHLEDRPGHEPCGHGNCRRCGDGCGTCDENERIDQISRYIGTLRTRAADSINAAEANVHAAIATFRELTSTHVYDIELAESSAGDDAHARLVQVARHLRDVARIIEVLQLRELLAAAEAQIPAPGKRAQ